MRAIWKDYSSWLPIFVLVLVMGYFLGLTIATVVDYRLKDAVINLPQPPKPKIVVKLPSEAVEGFTSAKKKKTTKTVEHFEAEVPTNETRPLFQIQPTVQETVDQIQDPTVKSYELAYELSQKLAKQGEQSFPYMAANYESSEGQYTNVSDPANFQKIVKGRFVEDKDSRVVRPAHNKIDVTAFRRSQEQPFDLPKRTQWCPNFKQQRPWENTLNHPNVVIEPKRNPLLV